jgi:hypothetical protein
VLPPLTRDSTAYRGASQGSRPPLLDRSPPGVTDRSRMVRHRHLGALRDHDPNPPVAHTGDPPGPKPQQTTNAHAEHAPAAPPEGGSRAVHVGTATGSPAAAPERLGTEAPRHPDTALGSDEVSQLAPARPVATSPSPPPSPPNPRPTAPAPRCCHRTTATRSEDPTAAPCVATGCADHG